MEALAAVEFSIFDSGHVGLFRDKTSSLDKLSADDSLSFST